MMYYYLNVQFQGQRVNSYRGFFPRGKAAGAFTWPRTFIKRWGTLSWRGHGLDNFILFFSFNSPDGINCLFPCNIDFISELRCWNTTFQYTGCNRRNGPDFGRVFLRSNYTDITQNTYIQSWTVTEKLAREKSGLLWCLRTVLVSVTSFSPLLELHSYVRANVAPAT